MNTVPLELNRQDLFTCPIYRGNDKSWLSLDKHVDPIINKIRKETKEKLKKGEIDNLPNSYHSHNLWQDDVFKPFAEFVMQQMWNILSTQGYDLKGRQPLLQECWVQEFPEEGGFHDIHIHSNNHMSGFYFLKCSPETSNPSFHDPRAGKMMTDLKSVNQKKINVCNNSVHYNVKPGQFIFFNSWMPHAYSHHKGKEKFRFIHFNMAAVISNNAITDADKE